jgi:hexosaminidase
MKSKVNQRIIILVLIALTSIMVSCKKQQPSDITKESLIPRPVSVYPSSEWFTLKPRTAICYSSGNEELRMIAEYLGGRIRPATGYELKVKESPGDFPKGSINLVLTGDQALPGSESYTLLITERDIRLSASKPEGLFRGVQTLMQLLPARIETLVKQEGPWQIPSGTITDYPAYTYRGAMLDVSRHFFGVEDVKRFIDLISYYKMNFLHLHLSDDQGWRIEIKSWPNLTEHGGSTQVGGGKGGFFTQEQYSEIVKYAQDRYITIVPEIDMPGHTNAALASYAELNCDGKAPELYTGINVGFSSLCTRKEITYKFVNDVIRELAALTPGPYIHIGGDESHSTKKDDYIYFINKVQEIVTGNGKQVLGWDDISLATLKPNTVIQHWARVKNAAKGAEQGAKIILSPATRAYLDMQYDTTSKYGLHWAGYVDVDSSYIWEPSDLIPGVSRESILGVEAPLWSETVTNMEEIEYMAFPRLPGIAEIGWSPAPQRNWEEYRIRLGRHGERMKAMGVDYFPSTKVPWAEVMGPLTKD